MGSWENLFCQENMYFTDYIYHKERDEMVVIKMRYTGNIVSDRIQVVSVSHLFKYRGILVLIENVQ